MSRALITLGLLLVAGCAHDWDRLGDGGDGGASASTSTGASSSSYSAATFCQFACGQRQMNCPDSDGTCAVVCPGYVENCTLPDDSDAIGPCVGLAYDNCTSALVADGSFSSCVTGVCEPE